MVLLRELKEHGYQGGYSTVKEYLQPKRESARFDERQIRELRTLRFIHEASNVIFLGPPGVGKTHLSVALAEAAIQAGLGAYFMTAHDLVHDLSAGPTGKAGSTGACVCI